MVWDAVRGHPTHRRGGLRSSVGQKKGACEKLCYIYVCNVAFVSHLVCIPERVVPPARAISTADPKSPRRTPSQSTSPVLLFVKNTFSGCPRAGGRAVAVVEAVRGSGDRRTQGRGKVREKERLDTGQVGALYCSVTPIYQTCSLTTKKMQHRQDIRPTEANRQERQNKTGTTKPTADGCHPQLDVHFCDQQPKH